MARKFYVVWEGRHPGVYEDWADAQDQVENFPGAKFKSFSSQEAAVKAFRSYLESDGVPLGQILVEARQQQGSLSADLSAAADRLLKYSDFPEIDLNGWAVDASCMGNPGIMEYRGVELRTGRELFRVGPFQDATNNIGEFLAIVHALALQYKTNEWHTIYSDSATGMAWVRNRQIKTTLKPTARNTRLFELMQRGINWLSTHRYDARILKWQTKLWGEIPADFGRK